MDVYSRLQSTCSTAKSYGRVVVVLVDGDELRGHRGSDMMVESALAKGMPGLLTLSVRSVSFRDRPKSTGNSRAERSLVNAYVPLRGSCSP